MAICRSRAIKSSREGRGRGGRRFARKKSPRHTCSCAKRSLCSRMVFLSTRFCTSPASALKDSIKVWISCGESMSMVHVRKWPEWRTSGPPDRKGRRARWPDSGKSLKEVKGEGRRCFSLELLVDPFQSGGGSEVVWKESRATKFAVSFKGRKVRPMPDSSPGI